MSMLVDGGSACVRPRLDRPSTALVWLANDDGSVARVAGAKYVSPFGARKPCNCVPNALPTSAAEPVTRTSSRFADTEETVKPLAPAQSRTAWTVAVDGANCELNCAGVNPPPRAAARSSPALSRGASAIVTGTEARLREPVSADPL